MAEQSQYAVAYLIAAEMRRRVADLEAERSALGRSIEDQNRAAEIEIEINRLLGKDDR